MRALRWIGYSASLLALILLIAVCMLLLTPAGVGLSVNVATRLVPALAVQGWRGSLLTAACAAEIRYETESVDVLATDACIAPRLWTSLELLRVDLESVTASSLTVQPRADQQPASGPDSGYAPGLPMRLIISELALDELRVGAVTIRDLRGALAMDGSDLEADLELSYDAFRVQAGAAGPWQALTITGTLSVPERIDFAVDLDLTQAATPYAGTMTTGSLDLAPWTSRRARLTGSELTLTGDLERYRFQLITGLTDAALGRALIAVDGSGDLTGLDLAGDVTLDPIDTTAELGSMAVAGTLGWAGEISFDLRARGRSVTIQTTHMLAELSAELRARGSPAVMQLAVTDVDGLLNGYALSGAASVAWRDGDLEVETADLAIGGGRLRLSGSRKNLRDQASLSLSAAANALPAAALDARLDGRVSGTFELQDHPQNATVAAHIELKEPRYDGYDLQRLRLDYAGPLDGGQLDFELGRAGGTAAGRMDLSFDADRLDAVLRSLSVAYPVPGAEQRLELELTAPAQLEVAQGAVELSRACFRSPNTMGEAARLCAALSYPQGGASLSVADLKLPQLALPAGDVAVQGLLDANLEIERFEPLEGTFEISLSELIAAIDDFTRELGELNADGAFTAGAARLNITSPEDQVLTTRGRLDAELAAQLPDSRLDGSVSVTVQGIRLIEEFLPMELVYEISDLEGELSADARVTGTLAAPTLDGVVRARDAAWRVEAAGASFRAVSMSAALSETTRLTFDAAGQLGDGSVVLTGNLDDLGGDAARLKAELALDGAEVVDLPDYSATLSGKVALDVTPAALQVAGDLSMPSARIIIAELPETAVARSEDAVIVGEAERPAQQVRTSKVQLALGEDVRLEAYGLKTRLAGSLVLTETPGRPPDLRGVVTLVDGQAKAFGQDLDITRGELSFVGPLDDPLVNVTASKIIERDDGPVVVSLVLTGSAQAIETEVRSSPSYQEGDALALLLTGRTLTEMSTGEQSNVYGAAIALGLYGASDTTRSLMTTMGVEEIIVREDEGEWEVGAAVRLQRNLYLRYTYNVYSRLGGVLLRYALTDRVSVRGRTGDSHSIEIRYGID